MPNYRSLIGGFFSSTPMDKSTGPVTIRMNNPGAINGASWETTYPGYVDTVETTPGNRSTIFEAPEYGVGAWWELLRRYRANNVNTVGGIITRYGGGQDYSAYVQFVAKLTGFTPDTVIDLNNDQQVLQFGRAMFRYEAGRALPWSDDQILYAIKCARTGQWPASPSMSPPRGPVADGQIRDSDVLPLLQKTLVALAANGSNPQAAQATGTDSTSVDVGNAPASPVLSAIDKMFGSEALVGLKTMLGVVGYTIVAILQASGVIAADSATGHILSVLTIAFAALGGISKVDRMTQSLGTIAGAKSK
jgi:hypothetical protein